MAPERVRDGRRRSGERQGFDLVVMYGQTEATARMAVLPPDLADVAPGAIGRPVPGGGSRCDRCRGPTRAPASWSTRART